MVGLMVLLRPRGWEWRTAPQMAQLTGQLMGWRMASTTGRRTVPRMAWWRVWQMERPSVLLTAIG